MVKASIMSCVLHVVVLLVVISLTSLKPSKIMNAGENIEVRMVSENKGALTDPVKGNSLEDRTKMERKIDKVVEESVDETREKKTIVKKSTETKEATTKKIEKPEETDKKKIDKPDEEQVELKDKVIEEADQIEKVKTSESDEDEIKEKSDKEFVKADIGKPNETTEENVISNKEEVRGSEKGEIGKDLVELSDGSYMAKHQGVKGLSFGFISSPEPDYPSLARRLGFKDEMIIKVIMEFDSNGKLKDMKFVGDKDRFGFRNEVEKTVKQWKLTSIKYNDMDVKMKFYKSFKFESLN